MDCTSYVYDLVILTGSFSSDDAYELVVVDEAVVHLVVLARVLLMARVERRETKSDPVSFPVPQQEIRAGQCYSETVQPHTHLAAPVHPPCSLCLSLCSIVILIIIISTDSTHTT